MNYSVLMSVYDKEKPEYLEVAIKSILMQTLKTNDFVIVEDGTLNQDLENVIKKYEVIEPNIIHVLRRKENKGLGESLREGVLQCKNDIIARMDSDDYSVSERCEKQLLKILEGYDLVGTNIDEFNVDVEDVVATKCMPEDKEEICQYAKFRNPFNHPSVMYRKEAVIKAGNYKDIFRLEDYDLWMRMLSSDIACCNIQESLVRMRINTDFYKRRGGKNNLKSHIYLKKCMLKNKQINYFEYIVGCALMLGRACCSNSVRQFLYKKVLRRTEKPFR